MVASHGSNADVVGNGYLLSEFFKSANFGGQRDTADSTTFKKKSKTYVPGLKDSTMSLEGIYDGAIDAVDQVLMAAFADNGSLDGIFSYIPEGNEVIGRGAYTIDAIESSYEINTEIGDVAQITAELSAGSRGFFTRGWVASPMSVKSAAGQSPTSVDSLLGVSTDKGSLVVHATASASLVVKMQHSTTSSGGTWVDLPGSLTFSSGRGSQRLVIPTQVINRYLRVSWTGTGTFLAIVES